eukprot:7378744-Prymnesium_polylepis.7
MRTKRRSGTHLSQSRFAEPDQPVLARAHTAARDLRRANANRRAPALRRTRDTRWTLASRLMPQP